MSCESVITDTYSYDFPFDWEASVYHWDTVVCLQEITESLEKFLDIINEQAYQFFFENVQQAEIDLIGCIDGVCRPATREASKKYLECAQEWGVQMDWQLSVLEISTMWLFNVEQIESMVNKSIKGHKQPFSIAHLITQKKVQDLLNDPPKDKRTKEDRPIHIRERNTLLKIIAALAIELKIPLTNSYKAGLVIEALTDKLGEGVSHKTIALKIKDISKLLKLPSN